MLNAIMGAGGEIALPDTLRERYGIVPDQVVRLIETRSGILLVPLTDAPMSAELSRELAEWQALGALAWDAFPYDEEEE